MRERWATFDCYGTLVDWNSGIRGELERLFGAAEAPRLLDRYHELEPEIESADPTLSYREVMARVLEALGAPTASRRWVRRDHLRARSSPARCSPDAVRAVDCRP